MQKKIKNSLTKMCTSLINYPTDLYLQAVLFLSTTFVTPTINVRTNVEYVLKANFQEF